MKVSSIKVSFRSPLRLKEIFNADSWEHQENAVIVKAVELDGYVGFSFETSKVKELEVISPVQYDVHLSNEELIKGQTESL
jgi:hypothetical protein